MSYDTSFYDVIAGGCRSSAAVVIPVLMDLFAPQKVIDVGCGEGHWLAEFKRHGCQVLGIDGEYVDMARLAILPSEFRAADLIQPPQNVKRHDLAVSLEVAEHLPAEAAERYVESLVHSAPIVVFSAAIPGQGGTGHINEQWPWYWEQLFEAHGYQGTAALRWQFWNNERVENWYRQNLLVFAAAPAELGEQAEALWTSPMAPITSVVHPVLWDSRR